MIDYRMRLEKAPQDPTVHSGVWIAMIVDWVFRSICFVIRYLHGKWRITGDSTIYNGGTDIYVNAGGEYTFEKVD